MRHYVAIDLGAESGRVMVGAIGDRIELREVHRFANVPVHVEGRLCWDVAGLWQEMRAGLAKVASEGLEISGIGVDTWGVDFGLVNEAGEMVGEAVCYRDSRTAGMAEKVFAKLSRERVYEIAGIQTSPINTLFQLASLSFGGSEELATAARLLFLPDLFSFGLCGRMGTEYTIASTSQMLDARTRNFSKEILAAIGVREELFLPVEMPGTVRGELLAKANETLAGTPVIVVGSHDTASAVAAVPAAGNDWLYLSSGTWSLLGAEVDEPVLTAKAAAFNLTNEGGVGGKIRLLKNIAGLWLLQECRRAWADAGRSFDYATLTAMAAAASGGGVTLDLSDEAFFSPGDMPAKIVAQCARRGVRAPTSEGEFVRVILESLAAEYAKVASEIAEVTGRRFAKLHVVGGGSRNDLLNQLAADATGLEVLAGPVEATALGNILAQGLTTGAIGTLAEGRALLAASTGVRVFKPRR